LARQNLVTALTTEKVSVVAIDKLKQLKRKYKHPEIRRGEYSIGTTRETTKPNELVITLEYPENFIMVGYLNVKKLRVRPHNLMIRSKKDAEDSKLQKNNVKAFRREINKTLAELEAYLVKHYRKESKKVKPIKKHVMESKWVRWRDYS